MSSDRTISFTYTGQAPSKANYRKGGKNWRERWRRIKDYEHAVGQLAMCVGVKDLARAFPDAKVSVEVDCYQQRADGDNIVKATLDGLIGVAFEDDAGVWSSSRSFGEGPARVVVTVSYGEALGRAE